MNFILSKETLRANRDRAIESVAKTVLAALLKNGWSKELSTDRMADVSNKCAAMVFDELCTKLGMTPFEKYKARQAKRQKEVA